MESILDFSGRIIFGPGADMFKGNFDTKIYLTHAKHFWSICTFSLVFYTFFLDTFFKFHLTMENPANPRWGMQFWEGFISPNLHL